MNPHTAKSDYYDPFSKQALERCEVPVQGTLTIGTPKAISGPCSPEKMEPWDKVAVALARALDSFGDALSRWLVIKAQTSTIEAQTSTIKAHTSAIKDHISIYKEIVEVEKTKAKDPKNPDITVSSLYWEDCLARSVKEFWKKPCDP